MTSQSEHFRKFISIYFRGTWIYVSERNLVTLVRWKVWGQKANCTGLVQATILSPLTDRTQNFLNVVFLDLWKSAKFDPDRLGFAEVIPERLFFSDPQSHTLSLGCSLYTGFPTTIYNFAEIKVNIGFRVYSSNGIRYCTKAMANGAVWDIVSFIPSSGC